MDNDDIQQSIFPLSYKMIYLQDLGGVMLQDGKHTSGFMFRPICTALITTHTAFVQVHHGCMGKNATVTGR